MSYVGARHRLDNLTLTLMMWRFALCVTTAFVVPATRTTSVVVREQDEDVAAYKARVAELGGKAGVTAQVSAKRAQRSVRSVQQSVAGRVKLSREPTATEREAALLSKGGWFVTLGCLALVVLLAVNQATRIDWGSY